MSTPRIYVACLASYNAGRLYGRWIDVDCFSKEIEERAQEMIDASPTEGAEEWVIHDYEGFGAAVIDEGMSLRDVVALAGAIEEHGELITHLHAALGGDLNSACDAMRDGYHGAYQSLEDYAQEFLDESGMLSEIPERLRGYFDTAAYARDLELGGSVFTIRHDGALHVFAGTV